MIKNDDEKLKQKFESIFKMDILSMEKPIESTLNTLWSVSKNCVFF